MADNNSSAFNYRFIAGTERFSKHAFGRALDVNPLQNPFVRSDSSVVPEGPRHDPIDRAGHYYTGYSATLY